MKLISLVFQIRGISLTVSRSDREHFIFESHGVFQTRNYTEAVNYLGDAYLYDSLNQNDNSFRGALNTMYGSMLMQLEYTSD